MKMEFNVLSRANENLRFLDLRVNAKLASDFVRSVYGKELTSVNCTSVPGLVFFNFSRKRRDCFLAGLNSIIVEAKDYRSLTGYRLLSLTPDEFEKQYTKVDEEHVESKHSFVPISVSDLDTSTASGVDLFRARAKAFEKIAKTRGANIRLKFIGSYEDNYGVQHDDMLSYSFYKQGKIGASGKRKKSKWTKEIAIDNEFTLMFCINNKSFFLELTNNIKTDYNIVRKISQEVAVESSKIYNLKSSKIAGA